MRRLAPAVQRLVPGCLLLLLGCAGLGLAPGGALRLSDGTLNGDAAFRASLLLVVDGLDADSSARRDRALRLYGRSLQVDPTNPYAYLAMARHHVAGDEPLSALPFLDKTEELLKSQGRLTLGAEAHLVGLRGAALLASGRSDEATPLLERARFLAPREWSDAWLDPYELR